MITLLFIALFVSPSEQVYPSTQVEVEETYTVIFEDPIAKSAADLSKCFNAVSTRAARKRLLNAVANKKPYEVRTKIYKDFFSGPQADYATVVQYHFKGRPIAKWCAKSDLLEIVGLELR